MGGGASTKEDELSGWAEDLSISESERDAKKQRNVWGRI